MKYSLKFRRGVTLLEVMFAIGVTLIGLLGVAFLIPASARLAGETIRMDESIQAGASVGSLSQSQKIADFSRMVLFSDDQNDPAAFPLGFRLASVARVLPGNLSPYAPNGQTPAVPQPGEIDSPGFARLGPGNTRLVDRFSGFCIDPMGILENRRADSSVSAYRYGVFPYYLPTWNPLTSPSNNPSFNILTPRLWRASLLRDIEGSPRAAMDVLPQEIHNRKSAEQIFTLAGNPTSLRLKDRSLPTVRAFEMFRLPDSTSVICSAANSGRFSWFATLTPGVDGGPIYTLSTVIVEGRSLDLLSLVSSNNRAEDNPAGERLTWVYNAVGFDGGGGGDISIVGSTDIVDRVKPGQWVMLSRQDYLFSPGNPATPRGPAQHGWYRVLAVSDVVTPQSFPYTVPTSTSNLWSRTLTLDGPDWHFDFLDNFLLNDTVCTIVDAAVEVIQTPIVMQ